MHKESAFQYNNDELFMNPKVEQYGSHMVMTNVRRDIKKKYWNIDTQFRDDYQEYSSNNPTQYTFSLPQSINNAKSIRVVNFELPMTYNNISPGLNNYLLTITSGSTVYPIGIPAGAYSSISSIVDAINTQISGTALNGYVNFSVNGSYVKFNTLNVGTFTLNIATGGLNNVLTTFDKYNLKSKLGWLLGFRQLNYTLSDSGSRQSVQSECFWNINNIRYIYLACDDFVTSNPNSFIAGLPTSLLNKNILAKISIDRVIYPYGSILPANPSNGYLHSDKRAYAGITNIQRLKVQLVNEYGQPLDLNGADFSFCIEIEYEG